MGSEELVAGALRDLESSDLTDKDKALLRFISKVNADSPAISASDMEPLHSAGWTDEDIYVAISVCALFNFYNRWIDASGVHEMSEEAHRFFGKRTAEHGYIRK